MKRGKAMFKRIIAILSAVMCVFMTAAAAGAAENDPYAEALIETYEAVTDYTRGAYNAESLTVQDKAVQEPEALAHGADIAASSASPVPEITRINPFSGGFTVSWSSYPGAYKYRLFIRKPDDSGWKRVGDTYDTVYDHGGLVSGTDYRYTVRALDSSGEFMSGYNNQGKTVTYFSVPVLSSVESVNAGHKVKWNAVNGAQNYRVYVKTPGAWISLGYTTETYFVNTAAESSETYTYTVRCYTPDGRQAQSYYNRSGRGGRYIAAPQITSFAPTDGGTKVSWSKVNGAAKYRLFIRKPDDSGWKKIGDSADTELTHLGTENGTVYKYTVRALDSAGNFISGYNSAGWLREYLSPAELSSVKYARGRYRLVWEPCPDAAGYEIVCKTFGGEWTSLGKVSGASSACTYSGAEPGEMYAFTVVYLDSDGERMNAPANDAVYYIDGEPADGEIEIDGSPIHFENGRVRKGYVQIDGKTYYYGADGAMQKSGIVGSAEDGYTAADANGVCCVSEEIRLAAEYMMKNAKGDTLDEKMKTGFLYMAKNYPYRRSYDHPSKASDMPALAIDLFKSKSGNCYRYAAAFACVAKAAGHRSRVVIGETIGNPHGWVEVLVDGKWLVCDPDAQLPGYGVPDYAAYMMNNHYWSIDPTDRFEIIIDENGVAYWK